MTYKQILKLKIGDKVHWTERNCPDDVRDAVVTEIGYCGIKVQYVDGLVACINEETSCFLEKR